ncbi:MAG: hypothetical protein AAGC93_28490, partial [Cyanobacteria bacterium P01_F01_bin.53]
EDSKREGIEGLTISLFNQKQRWVRALGVACTDEQGYFVIDYSIQDTANPPVSPNQPLILTVTDDDRQILHQESQPLFANIGAIDYREIVLEGTPKVIVTPETDDSNNPPRGPRQPR